LEGRKGRGQKKFTMETIKKGKEGKNSVRQKEVVVFAMGD